MQPALGAQLFTVRSRTQNAADLLDSLRRIRGIGYRAVQVSGIGPIDPQSVADCAAEAGVAIAATHLPWERFLTDLDAVVAEHRLWNCRHSAIGSLPGEYRSPAGLERFLEELAPVGEALAEAGLTFSYHNHHHEFVRQGKTTWLGELYDRAPAGQLCAELDTHWVQRGGGSPAAWIRRVRGRCPLLHLKDLVLTPDLEPRFAEVGEGNLDWAEILDAARGSGVEWCLVEQDDCYGRDPFEALATSYRNLKAMGLS